VELAALDHRRSAQHVAERLAQPLAPVDHTQHAPVDREAPQQVLEQLR